MQTCIVPGCNSPAGKTRGLCEACYRCGCRLVRRRKASWAEIERFGLALEAKPHRPNTNLLGIALRKMRSLPVFAPQSAPAFIRPDNSSARVWSGLVNSLNGSAA